MTEPLSAARLGIWDDLLPGFQATGWIDGDGHPIPQAGRLLLALRRGPDAEGGLERLAGTLQQAPELASAALDQLALGDALVAVVGASRALTQTVAEHPDWLREAVHGQGPESEEPERPPHHEERLLALRRFVRRGLLRVAVRDLLGLADMPQVGRELSDIADAAAQAALRVVEEHLGGPPVPVALIAMGKWGGGELNYASDIDVLFVYQVPEGVEAEAASAHATRVAEGFLAALGGVTSEGVAFRVDPDLRPEGRDGPLARSLESYRAYYQRWARPWEFQALIKARPAAGDPATGQAFSQMVEPFVYPETLSPQAVREVRVMKARIEAERLGPDEDPEFHLKLGRGGLVDVEFVTQLHQLLHGGRVPEVRTQGTLPALQAIGSGGLLPEADTRALSDAYRFCGRVRNRLYLQAGRPRDSLPTDMEEATRLALSLGYLTRPRSSLREDYRRHTRRARRVVEHWFYGD